MLFGTILEGGGAGLVRIQAEDGRTRRMATVRQRLSYHSNTRLIRSAEIDMVGHDDSVRTIGLEPILRFHMKGIGYLNPEWGHGMWKGELATGHDCFDPASLDLLQPANFHVQQVVRARDGSSEGIGILEQVVLGPYAPAGFRTMTDGAA